MAFVVIGVLLVAVIAGYGVAVWAGVVVDE